MAHVILFTDRAPDILNRADATLHSYFYTFTSGAYKIASVVRGLGLDVLVVPNCLSLSLSGIKRIINKNKQDLLWVGFSTSFWTLRSEHYEEYRTKWATTDEDFVDVEILFGEGWNHSSTKMFEMAWSSDEIGLVSTWLKTDLSVPLLIGGAAVTNLDNNLFGLNRPPVNAYVVKGNAEIYVKEFTEKRLANSSALPSVKLQKLPQGSLAPVILNNNYEYDMNDFKSHSIEYNKTDQISVDDWLPLEVSRGCAFNCAYCMVEYKNQHDLYKNPQILRDEIIRNYELFGVTKYLLVDNLYNDSKEKVRRLYDEVWSRLPFTPEWSSYIRLDLIWADPDSIKILEASGLKCGTMGIETLHDVAGRKVAKGLGRRRILEALQMCKDVWQDRVMTTSQWIAGLPDEPLESILETMEWTETTDLIHSSFWNTLTVPNISGTDWKKENLMSQNLEKYGYQFIRRSEDSTVEDSWINRAGVTKDQARLAVADFYQRNKKLRICFGAYPDYRALGLSHEDIVKIVKTPIDQLPVDEWGSTIKNKIFNRLHQFIK